MKKFLFLLCLLVCFMRPSMAANNISTLVPLTQSEFRLLSEDLGSALSYKPITPAEPLGTSGFDFGLAVSSTDMKRSSQAWLKSSGSSINNLYIPKLHIAKGLPFNLDVAAFYSSIPSTNIKLYGGELRYAILEGGIAAPAIAIRGSYTKMSGVNQLSFDTKGLDISISKGFALFTPYAGFGRVWSNSTPQVSTLSAEKFSQSKLFVGTNMNFGLTNFALEADKTGAALSYSAKLGFRF